MRAYFQQAVLAVLIWSPFCEGRSDGDLGAARPGSLEQECDEHSESQRWIWLFGATDRPEVGLYLRQPADDGLIKGAMFKFNDDGLTTRIDSEGQYNWQAIALRISNLAESTPVMPHPREDDYLALFEICSGGEYLAFREDDPDFTSEDAALSKDARRVVLHSLDRVNKRSLDAP